MSVFPFRPSKFPDIEAELVQWLIEVKRNRIQLSDALIRAKAKETASALGITDDRFKASSGWVENFKHRHGIRQGVWHGNGRNLQRARAMGLVGNHLEEDPALSPLNPAFDGRTLNGHGSDFEDELDELDESPDGDDRHRQGYMQTTSMALQPAWPEANDNGHSSSQSDPSLSNNMASNDPPEYQEHEQQEFHTHSHILGHELQIIEDQPGVYPQAYEPVREIPDHSMPTLEGADEALNKVILYLDSTRSDLIDHEQRLVLDRIKRIFFQAISGIPIDRSG